MKFLLYIFLAVALFGNGYIADAQTDADLNTISSSGEGVYEPVVQIPGLDPDTQSTEEYVHALYMLAITIAALLAVVKIIFGGAKWMLSDVVTDKASAKKDIQGALLGLLIVLSAVLILNTINADLTKLNFLKNAPPISITLSQQKSACESDPDSSLCCMSKGGTYIADPTGNRCSVGASIPLPEDVQGDALQSKILCESTHRGIWNGSECLTTSGREIPYPEHVTPENRQNFCVMGHHGIYNAETGECREM